MKVTTTCEHRTTVVEDAGWDAMNSRYLGQKIRVLILACPACQREADNNLERDEQLDIAPPPRQFVGGEG